MRHAGVLVDFTKAILHVDCRQLATEESHRFDSQLFGLPLCLTS